MAAARRLVHIMALAGPDGPDCRYFLCQKARGGLCGRRPSTSFHSCTTNQPIRHASRTHESNPLAVTARGGSVSAHRILLRCRFVVTIVVMSIESVRSVRDHFSEVVERVERHHERVTVTRNGRAAAVLISPDGLAALEETIDVLSDPAALADIREADAGYARGDVVRGDAVRGSAPCRLSMGTNWY